MFSQSIFNSLKFRLMLSAGLMIMLVLPVIGIALSNIFEQKLMRSIKNELSAYSYSILAVAEVEGDRLIMPEQLMENQFNVSQSGLYSLITSLTQTENATQPKESTETLWRSHSLLTLNLPQELPQPTVGLSEFSSQVFDNQKHFVFSYSVSFSMNVSGAQDTQLDDGMSKEISIDFPFTIHIIKDEKDFEQLVNQFQQDLGIWLIVLMILLVVIQIFWLLWTLKPLKSLKDELHRVEQGELAQLEKSYPVELAQVTKQLNLLLHTEQGQRQRYRNALADLAHSLKNPLAVIQSQAELSFSSQQQITLINQMIEHQLKRAQSAGESSWFLGVKVNITLDKLINSLEKIYRDKAISFSKHCDENIIFKGDEADLLEMLGNLLDNACKAAKRNVAINIQSKDDLLVFQISDDGCGISSSNAEQILMRGVRADTYQQGHGIGLAIVRDLVASYQGELTIDRCKQLGGALFIVTFRHERKSK